jgi:hypothetical protein
MHLYWTGVAADLYRAGDTSLQWLLEEAAAGEVFAAGHAEAGNDLPLLYSTARADRADGGYRFTGRKMFGSLRLVLEDETSEFKSGPADQDERVEFRVARRASHDEHLAQNAVRKSIRSELVSRS